MNASSLLLYFQPLHEWLIKNNTNRSAIWDTAWSPCKYLLELQYGSSVKPLLAFSTDTFIILFSKENLEITYFPFDLWTECFQG